MSLHVEIHENVAHRSFDIFVSREGVNGSIMLAKPITLDFEEDKPSEIPFPTLRLTGKDAQDFLSSLSQALASSGFKPSEVTNVTNELSAVRYHLEDMRRIAFRNLFPPILTTGSPPPSESHPRGLWRKE